MRYETTTTTTTTTTKTTTLATHLCLTFNGNNWNEVGAIVGCHGVMGCLLVHLGC